MPPMPEFTLEDLAGIIAERARSGDGSSYTADLLRKGVPRCAQKLGEEAVETVIAALQGDRAALRGEAADLLYHLLVLLHASGVSFSEVREELGRRTGQSGLAEKAARTGSPR